jgi:hypothetical protein
MIERLALVIPCLFLGISLIVAGYPGLGKGIIVGSLMVGLPLLAFYTFGGRYNITYSPWKDNIVEFKYPKWKRLLFLGYPILSQIEAKVAFRFGEEGSQDYSAWNNAFWEDTNGRVTRVDRPCIKRLNLRFSKYRRYVRNYGMRPFIGNGAILLKILLEGTEQELAFFRVPVMDFRLCADKPDPLEYEIEKDSILD